MQVELTRASLIHQLKTGFKLDMNQFLFAYTELRNTQDPVVPSTLPSGKRSDVRLKIESYLAMIIAALRSCPDDPHDAFTSESRLGRNVVLKPVGLLPQFAGAAEANAVTLPVAILDRIMRRATSTTVSRKALLTLVWQAVVRYKYLGLWTTMSAATPPHIYSKFLVYDAVEGFASLFNSVTPRYYGLFPDIEHHFGCVGNFFAVERTSGLLLCNPPYISFIINAFAVKVETLLESNPVTVVCILPAFETSDRKALNDSGRCDSAYPVDYETDVDTSLLKNSPFSRWCGLYCKNTFAFVESTTGKSANLTSVLLVILSSQERMSPTVSDIIVHFPKPDVQCSKGQRAMALYLDPILLTASN